MSSEINETITLTFGDCGENHKGMEMIGKLANKGISMEQLIELSEKLPNSELIDLSYDTYPEAGILIVRNGIDLLLKKYEWISDDLYEEQSGLDWDQKAFMYGRVVNKHARHNLCFSDYSQEPNYEEKKGRIINFDDVIITDTLRTEIMKLIDWEEKLSFGLNQNSDLLPQGNKLICEGNRYYDVNKCGIGYHGDSERRIVIGCRLGASMSLHYQWFYQNKPVGDRFDLLNHGDFYIMSEKAVGFDWKKRNMYTLRHSAGCEKFTKV